MKLIHAIAAMGCLGAATPALADDPQTGVEVRNAVHQALEERAQPPAQAPKLPDATTEQPQKQAHPAPDAGQKAAAEHAARDLADKQAEAHARRAQVEASQPGERGASDEARRGSAESHAAISRDRTNEVRGNPHGGGQGQGQGQGPAGQPDSILPRGRR